MASNGFFKSVLVLLGTLVLVGAVFSATASPSVSEPPVASSFRYPLAGDWVVTHYDFAQWVPARCAYHLGQDLGRDAGTPVYAPAAGRVRYADYIAGAGYTVNIEHKLPDGSHVVSVYFHLQAPGQESPGGISLSPDELIEQGEVIGYLTGRSKDNGGVVHLHFGIRAGPYRYGIDPRTNYWYYPGYTSIRRKVDNKWVKVCDKNDTTHQEIINEWHDPGEFIQARLGPPTPTLSVTLSAEPSSGAAPLNGVDLTADVSGTATGTINCTFYCDRPDAGTNVTSGWAAKFDGVLDDPKTAVDACNYPTAGTYTAKVIVERGNALPAEARASITVSAPTPGPAVNLAPNPSFEVGASAPDGWTPDAGHLASWDATVSHTGGKSARTRFEFPEPCGGPVSYWVTTEPIVIDRAAAYILSTWAMISNTPDAPPWAFCIGVNYYDASGWGIGGNGRCFGPTAPEPSRVDPGVWTQVSFELDPSMYPADLAYVQVELIGPFPDTCDVGGSATTWFDDVYFGRQ